MTGRKRVVWFLAVLAALIIVNAGPLFSLDTAADNMQIVREKIQAD